MVKRYVLDTNILLEDPDSFFGFEDNTVIINTTVLQELSNKKTDTYIGYEARKAIHNLDKLWEMGDLVNGVKLPNGGTFMIEPDGICADNIPNGFDIKKGDNQIISSCVHLQKQSDMPLILVTNDIIMRVSASVVLGHDNVQGYKNTETERSSYTGHLELEMDKSIIDQLYKDKSIKVNLDDLINNQFITLKSGQSSALSVYMNGELKLVNTPHVYGSIKPLNAMQTYAMWALMNPDIDLVIFEGPAGTAKTFMSLAAGLGQTYDGDKRRRYNQVMISRPNTETSDNGFGYLPGTLEEKMEPLLAPYFDNLKSILKGNTDEDNSQIQTQIEDMFETGVIDMCALSFIRGRSLPNTYLICDEAQNAPRLLIKDIITRAGKGTKIVICGDPDQCDNPRLNKINNGLVYAAECWKGSKRAVVLKFGNESSVRSPLAAEALERMTL